MTYAKPPSTDRVSQIGSLDDLAAAFALRPVVEAEGMVESLGRE